MPSRRINQIQVYRGIAITSVLTFHLFDRWRMPRYSEDLYPWQFVGTSLSPFKLGYLGVNLFFIISGFVIIQSLENTQNIKDFFVKRTMRIYPSLTLVILLFFAIGRFVGNINEQGTSIDPSSLIPSLTLINPKILISIFPSLIGMGWVSGVLWSLWIEISFYFCISLLFYTTRKNIEYKFFFLCLIFISLNFFDAFIPNFFAEHPWLDAATELRHYCLWFYIGIIAFKRVQGQTYNRFLLMTSMVINCLIENSRNSVDTYILHIVVTSLIVLLTLAFEPKILLFSHSNLLTKSAGFLGDISYEIYLLHEFLLLLLLKYSGSAQLGYISVLLIISYICIILILSYILKKFVSDPLSKKLRSARSPKTSSP